MTLYKVRIMKKVAIVTPEALAPRSFLWDDVAERLKVKLNNLMANTISREEDGLYILGTEGPVTEKVNELGRVLFSDNAVNLPHLKLELSTDDLEPLKIVPKAPIDEMHVAYFNDGISTQSRWDVGPGQVFPINVINSCRISYVYNETIMVADVFLARNGSFSEDAFVDVVLNVKKADFPTVLVNNFDTEILA